MSQASASSDATVSGIEITLNGAPRTVPAGLSVAALLGHLGTGPAGVAVAVEDAVVRRSDWDATPVEAGQRVEVITATAGG